MKVCNFLTTIALKCHLDEYLSVYPWMLGCNGFFFFYKFGQILLQNSFWCSVYIIHFTCRWWCCHWSWTWVCVCLFSILFWFRQSARASLHQPYFTSHDLWQENVGRRNRKRGGSKPSEGGKLQDNTDARTNLCANPWDQWKRIEGGQRSGLFLLQ